MSDLSHLNALELRHFNESQRLNAATKLQEIVIRTHIVAMCAKEINGERAFLGLAPMSDIGAIDEAELLAELLV